MKRFLWSTYGILLCFRLLAQNPINGEINNAQGFPIPFAVVYNMAGNSTVCDQHGKFSLQATTTTHKLIVAAMGYYTDTLDVAGNHFKHTLTAKSFDIKEIEIIHQQSIKKKSMVSAQVTSKKDIEALRPKNISEVLQNESGFTNRSGYQTPLTLRGMSGKRLLVLRNGMKRFSSYPAGFMSHTVNIYDLERIDIEKGASSVIYGAGAIAGIVNLIDKSPFKQAGLNARLTTGFASINNEKSVSLCGGWSNNKLAIKAGVRTRNAGNFTYPDKSIAANSDYTDKDLFFTSGYRFASDHYVIFNADIHNGGPWGKPIGFNGSKYTQVRTNEEVNQNFSLRYRLKGVEWNVYFSNESRELEKNYYAAADYSLSFNETTYFSDHYYGSEVRWNYRHGKSNKLSIGGEYTQFVISSPVYAQDYIEDVNMQNRVCENAMSMIAGVYAEEKIEFSPNFKTVLGIRFNHSNIYEGEVYDLTQNTGLVKTYTALNGNIGMMYNNRASTFKLNIARSLRMPETTEMFADNYSSNGMVYGNPDLKPEFCYGTDFCYQFASDWLNFEISPFVWLMQNMISKEKVKGYSGNNYMFMNIDKTRMMGCEAFLRLKFDEVLTDNNKLSFQTGAAYLHGAEINTELSYFSAGTPLNFIPPLNIKSDIKYGYTINKHVSFNLMAHSIAYTQQKRLGDDPFATPAYMAFGCTAGLNYSISKLKSTLNISVDNLFNQEYYQYQSYLPSEGRDIRVFLTISY